MRQILWEIDVEKILSIPICKIVKADCWAWRFTKNGQFSTKSAYKMFVRFQCLPSSSGEGPTLTWWKKMWS